MSESDRQRRVGVVGLGAMGSALVARLLDCGVDVIGFDVDPAKNAYAKERGAAIARSSSDLARRSARIVCLVDTASQVKDAILGQDGVLAGAERGDVVLCMSTVELSAILVCHDGLSARGVDFVDAFVSGGPKEAKSGSLVVFAGGNADAIERSRFVFEATSSASYRMGAVGSGFGTKMINNILFHVASVAVIEALMLGRKAGLDPQKMIDVLSRCTGDSAALRARAPRFLSRDFKGIPMRIAYREMLMETDFARLHKCPLLLANVAEQVYAMGIAAGFGEEDGAALVKIYEKMAGVTL
jgi:3-hydroxyisobutyrate dehydrogenase-like beta-hydroxyacid dehydrogenase